MYQFDSDFIIFANVLLKLDDRWSTLVPFYSSLHADISGSGRDIKKTVICVLFGSSTKSPRQNPPKDKIPPGKKAQINCLRSHFA